MLRRTADRLERFLFSPLDARATAWFRLALAAAVPYFFWSVGLSGPRRVLGPSAWVYAHVVTSVWYALATCGLCAVLAVGYRSRAVALVLFALLVPTAYLSHGGTSRPVLLFSILAFSFARSDAVRWPWQRQTGRPDAGPAWPVRLVQLQLSALYLVNAIAKSKPAYLRGNVLEALSISRPNFLVDLSSGVFHLGPLAVPVMVAAVATTLTEYFLGLAFWRRQLRFVAAAVGILFHWELTRVVTIYKLNLAAIFLYLAFLLPLVAGGDRPGAASAPELTGRPG